MKKPREIIIDGDIAKIPLTQGYVAIIDAIDVPLVEGRNWCASRIGRRVYARASEPKPSGGYTTVLLHRVLLGLTEPEVMGDHRDGDGLNNRRANLRKCSNGENCCNRGAQGNNTSGFKGVWWGAKQKRWIAELHVAGARKYRACFTSPEAAHAAYAEAAAKFHGQFARTS